MVQEMGYVISILSFTLSTSLQQDYLVNSVAREESLKPSCLVGSILGMAPISWLGVKVSMRIGCRVTVAAFLRRGNEAREGTLDRLAVIVGCLALSGVRMSVKERDVHFGRRLEQGRMFVV